MADFFHFEPMDDSLIIHCQGSVAPHQIDMADCKERIVSVVEEHQSTEVVFHLGEVQILSSRLLALMAAVQQLGVSVWVESPSPRIVGLLKLTRYDAVIKIRQPVP